jgi:carbamoyltransferase
LKKLLIGVHLGSHDLNLSLYDGKKFKYIHYERHCAYKNAGLTKLNEAAFFIRKCIEVYGYDTKDIKSIACTIGERDDLSVFLKDEKTLVSKINLFENFDECYQLDHHYAHALSSFPVIDTNNHYVNDGHGDWHKYLSVIKKDKLNDYLVEGLHGNSFGGLLQDLCEIQGLSWNDAGKLMAFIGFGKIDYDYINKFKDQDLKNSHVYSHSREFLRYSYNKGVRKDLYDISNQSNFISTLHKLYEIKFLDFLKNYFNKNESFSYSGGIAQSIVLNTSYKKMFPNMTITPHCGDSGLSLGCIEWLRKHYGYDPINMNDFPFIQADEHPGAVSKQTIKKTAQFLAKKKIVLWYQGHGEVGPRALGNRSILMSPEGDKNCLNEKVKKREWYRPYGASVTIDNYKQYFDLDWDSPYMLYNSKVKDTNKFKCITHVDGTCRIQTVSNKHEVYFDLLCEFEKLTGFPILLNTSLNIQGKPIVGTKKQAKIMFDNSNADILVIGDDMYVK